MAKLSMGALMVSFLFSRLLEIAAAQDEREMHIGHGESNIDTMARTFCLQPN